MASRGYADSARVRSWLTPQAVKGGGSVIEGRGNILLLSMRGIAAGEELTIDYALFLGDPGFAMDCRRGTPSCRGTVRGTDRMRADLQERYGGWFSWWLRHQITRSQHGPAARPGPQR